MCQWEKAGSCPGAVQGLSRGCPGAVQGASSGSLRWTVSLLYPQRTTVGRSGGAQPGPVPGLGGAVLALNLASSQERGRAPPTRGPRRLAHG